MITQRIASTKRITKETQIEASVNLDGCGLFEVTTGIGFLDHMMEQLSRHSLIDLNLKVKGDLHIDFHHTTEDSGYAFGDALKKALGTRIGIMRYGNAKIPMDEALTEVSIDISGRPFLSWHVKFSSSKVGDMDTELFKEWFRAFAQSAGITIHVRNLYGENTHHIIESCYKALARALREATSIDVRSSGSIPSTKGTIGGELLKSELA